MCHILKLFSFQERSVPILGGVIDSSLFISTLDNTCEETNNIIIEEINVVEVFNWHQLRGKMTSQFKFTKTYYAARCFFSDSSTEQKDITANHFPKVFCKKL